MSKGNLLIVDDEKIILKTLKLNLEDYADEIYTAENGLEALKKFDEREIHCVVCDINMPKMNGVEVIKTIRKNGNKNLMMEVVKYGAFDFLNKPDLDSLEDVVIRGLKEGFDRKSGVEISTDIYESEYRKLLVQIAKNQNS